MTTFVYPSNAELREIEQDLLPRLEAGREAFKLMPSRTVDDDLIMYEQQDNYIGLQQVRGMNGASQRVKKVGVKRYIVTPGVYGEYADINEDELTRRRRFGSFGNAVDITDLVMVEQNKLLQRRLDRMEAIIWTLITTGTFSVSVAGGGALHTDTFPLQTFSPTLPWSNLASATPLADLRAMKLLHRGHSVAFDNKARLYANQATINNVLNNQNANDLFGRRTMGFTTINNLNAVNELLTMDDLPNLAAFDEGYYDDTNTFQLFIPNGKASLVGRRLSGTPIGSYCFTRNANNPDLGPGPGTKVVDHGETQVPRRIAVHDFHNGGPEIDFPSAIIALSGI